MFAVEIFHSFFRVVSVLEEWDETVLSREEEQVMNGGEERR